MSELARCVSLVMDDLEAEPEPLSFSIAASSGHSGSYVPDNVLTDRPADQSSRWSGAHAQGGSADVCGPGVRGQQFLLLKLERMAVVRTICASTDRAH